MREIDSPSKIPFKIGLKVTFVNDYGASFPGKTITGTRVDPVRGRVYNIEPTDTPWFEVSARNLFIEHKQD